MAQESATLLRLMAGFRRFRRRFFLGDNPLFPRLAASGQSPKVLIIACSDSRVDPAILADASPGDLFVVRNVANLVPPFERSAGFHGVSAAIEFAVVNLNVETVMVMGHRQCGGIRSLFEPASTRDISFVRQWMTIATEAKKFVLDANPAADVDTLSRACERESIAVSLRNLGTFPFVQEAMRERGLTLVGVYFDLEAGRLLRFDAETNEFLEIN